MPYSYWEPPWHWYQLHMQIHTDPITVEIRAAISETILVARLSIIAEVHHHLIAIEYGIVAIAMTAHTTNHGWSTTGASSAASGHLLVVITGCSMETSFC